MARGKPESPMASAELLVQDAEDSTSARTGSSKPSPTEGVAGRTKTAYLAYPCRVDDLSF